MKRIGFFIALATVALSSCKKDKLEPIDNTPPTDYTIVLTAGYEQLIQQQGLFTYLDLIRRNEDSTLSTTGNAFAYAFDSLSMTPDSTFEVNYFDFGSVKLNDYSLKKNAENVYAHTTNFGDGAGVGFNLAAVWEIGEQGDSTGLFFHTQQVQPDYPIVDYDPTVSLLGDVEFLIKQRISGASHMNFIVKRFGEIVFYQEMENPNEGNTTLVLGSDTLLNLGRGDYDFYVSAWNTSGPVSVPNYQFPVEFRNQATFTGSFNVQ